MRSCTDDAFSKVHNNLVEIILECTLDDYEILYNAFDNGEILCRGDETLKIKLNVSEDVFIHWYLTYWPGTITIIEPQHIKKRLVSQAQTILKNTEVEIDGKENQISIGNG